MTARVLCYLAGLVSGPLAVAGWWALQEWRAVRQMERRKRGLS